MSNIDKQIEQLDKELHNASMGAPDKWMRAVLLHAPQVINALVEENDELREKIGRLEAKEAQHRQAVEDGRWVLLPEEIHCGDKVGNWLIASVDFGSKMERVEAFYLIRESYLDEYVESTCTKAEAAILKEGTE